MFFLKNPYPITRSLQLPLAGLVLLVLSDIAFSADSPHQHGSARMEIVVEADIVEIRLVAPTDSILGFEHAPGTAAEKQNFDNAEAYLRDGSNLFTTGADQCEVLSSAVNMGVDAKEEDGHSHHDHSSAGKTHADVEASYRLDCPREDLNFEVDLFNRFKGLDDIKVQWISASSQGQVRLTRSQPLIVIGSQ